MKRALNLKINSAEHHIFQAKSDAGWEPYFYIVSKTGRILGPGDFESVDEAMNFAQKKNWPIVSIRTQNRNETLLKEKWVCLDCADQKHGILIGELGTPLIFQTCSECKKNKPCIQLGFEDPK
jgi:hypothetical protein